MNGMQHTTPPSVRNHRRLDIACNLVAVIAVTIGVVLTLRASWHGFSLDFNANQGDLDSPRDKEAQSMHLMAWIAFIVGSGALAVRRRWITAAILLSVSPVAVALVPSGQDIWSAALVPASIATWVTIEKEGVWPLLLDRLRRMQNRW